MPRPQPASGRPARRGGGFVRSMGSRFGTQTVRIIHNADTDDETVEEVEAHIQGEKGFFDVDTPIFEGDFVEVEDPRRSQGVERRLATKVKVNNMGPSNMQHISVTWGGAVSPRVAPVRRLTFENLHPEVQSSAGSLFADGQYEAAVSEAFKSIEVRVRRVTGLDRSGAPLMAGAFKPEAPMIDVAAHEGHSGQDEREGFLHIFRGSMIGIRNPKAHELFETGDPQQALEYLGMASLLHRRIDSAGSAQR